MCPQKLITWVLVSDPCWWKPRKMYELFHGQKPSSVRIVCLTNVQSEHNSVRGRNLHQYGLQKCVLYWKTDSNQYGLFCTYACTRCI